MQVGMTAGRTPTWWLEWAAAAGDVSCSQCRALDLPEALRLGVLVHLAFTIDQLLHQLKVVELRVGAVLPGVLHGARRPLIRPVERDGTGPQE